MTLPGPSFSHPPYSSDLSSSDFHLFTHLKQFLGSIHLGRNEGVKEMVKDWFSGLVADFYDSDMKKLVTCYKCLNLQGHYVEK
jgi:hypothetical protein